eukprot:3811870-Pleurochrysis_carterae.AAC.1
MRVDGGERLMMMTCSLNSAERESGSRKMAVSYIVDAKSALGVARKGASRLTWPTSLLLFVTFRTRFRPSRRRVHSPLHLAATGRGSCNHASCE